MRKKPITLCLDLELLKLNEEHNSKKQLFLDFGRDYDASLLISSFPKQMKSSRMKFIINAEQ